MNKEKVVVSPKKEKVKTRKPKNYGFRKFFFGVGKEYKRISWLTKKQLFYNFLIVVLIILIFALIFTGISILMVNYIK